MKLSILIPLYNKEKFITRCLNSLLAQDLSAEEYEIIIVDDGSKDSGADIVDKFSQEHDNIHLIRQENQGPSAARNRCLESSKGEYLYFLDADDYLATHVLNMLLELGTQHQLEILEFNTKETTNEAPTDTVSQSPKEITVDAMDGLLYMGEYGFRNEAWRFFVKKQLLEDTGIKFIEGTLYEDAIFTASLILKAKRMAKLELDIHRYVVVENSIVTSKDRAHNLKFIKGMENAIAHFHGLIKDLDTNHPSYSSAVKVLKGRQQAFVFALIIRTLKFNLLSFKELKEVLGRLNTLDAYPIDPKIGGIGQGRTNKIQNRIFIPIFNSKVMLFLGLSLMRLRPSS